MQTAFLVFEASLTVGAGHAIRSAVIATELIDMGWQCNIVTSIGSYHYIKSLERFNRIEPIDFYNNPSQCDLLIIDNYNLDINYETYFRAYAQKILVIDDSPNRHHRCDFLLDQTYGREEIEYISLVPKECKILTGSKYALLRQEFAYFRTKVLDHKHKLEDAKRILVSIGGSDNDNLTLKLLKMIANSEFKGAIDIVLGFTSENRQSIETYVQTLPNECSIYINADMSQLMCEADLAIGAAGSSMWERCCLGLPTIMITLSQDQYQIAKNLHAIGAAINAGHIDNLKIENMVHIVNELIADNTKRSALKKIAFQVCDGLGVKRIMETINEGY